MQFFTTFWSLEVQKIKYLSRFKPLTNTMVYNHSNANNRSDFEHSYLLLFIYLFIFRFFTWRYQFVFLWLLIYVCTKKNKQTNKQTKTVQKYTYFIMIWTPDTINKWIIIDKNVQSRNVYLHWNDCIPLCSSGVWTLISILIFGLQEIKKW
jgi:predicted membrane protein